MKLTTTDLVVGELYQFTYQERSSLLHVLALDVTSAMKEINPLPLSNAKLSPMLYLGIQDVPKYSRIVHTFLGVDFITGNTLVCGFSNPCQHPTCNITKL